MTTGADSLTEAQLKAIRAGMYVSRYPTDPKVDHVRCRWAIGGRQCTGYATHDHPSGFPVCKRHQKAGTGHQWPR
jgi:hypothetical protein